MELRSEDIAEAIASKNVRVISTLLALAIVQKDVNAMKRLFDGGADLNCMLANDTTPLDCLIVEDDEEINAVVRDYCDERTLEGWRLQLKTFNALTGRQPRLSQGSFVADMSKQSPSAKAHNEAPPAEKKACCTIL
jgi:hypothetical protein